jgi:hypothetical protein
VHVAVEQVEKLLREIRCSLPFHLSASQQGPKGGWLCARAENMIKMNWSTMADEGIRTVDLPSGRSGSGFGRCAARGGEIRYSGERLHAADEITSLAPPRALALRSATFEPRWED